MGIAWQCLLGDSSEPLGSSVLRQHLSDLQESASCSHKGGARVPPLELSWVTLARLLSLKP